MDGTSTGVGPLVFSETTGPGPGTGARSRTSRLLRHLHGSLVPLFPFQKGFGDDDSLNLRGSLADLGELDVAVIAFDRIVFDEAVAAVDLDRLAGHAGRSFGRVQLRH